MAPTVGDHHVYDPERLHGRRTQMRIHLGQGEDPKVMITTTLHRGPAEVEVTTTVPQLDCTCIFPFEQINH